MSDNTEAIFFLPNLWSKNLALIEKNFPPQQIKLDNKHCDASESEATIGMYVGNEKHPKLFRQKKRFLACV